MPKKKEVKSGDDRRLFAFLATFLSIVGFVIALLVKRNDKYIMHYAKQSLVIFIAAVIASVIGWVLFFIPVLGWIVQGALNIIMAVLWIFSWVYALSNKEKEVPLVGKYARGIKL